MARDRLRRGFSLVELMAAVAIVGLLVSLALPRYRLFIARSRMAEAKTNLGIIYGLQQTYKAEFEKYGTITGGMGFGGDGCSAGSPGRNAKNELGFRVTDCNELRYSYRSRTASANANSNGSEIYPGCSGEYDVWNITAERKLEHLISAIKKCKD